MKKLKNVKLSCKQCCFKRFHSFSNLFFLYRRIIESAIPDVGTSSSGDFIIKAITNDEPNDSIVREDWLASLRHVRSPTFDMLEPAAKLVTQVSEYAISGRAYLGVGSLIHNFCFQNENCASNDQVEMAVGHFSSVLDQVCEMNNNEIEADLMRKANYAVRALGNTGSAIQAATNSISNCMLNRKLPTEFRIAALSAFRRVPCEEETMALKENLRSVIRDFNEDSEIRSVAFVSMMRCPKLDDISTARELIQNNDRILSEKLGVFIISFLRKSQEIPFPTHWNVDIQSSVESLLSTRSAKKLEMLIDPLKRGACYRYQQFLPRLNTGYMQDVNVIHSEKSIMPRQLLFNLTVGLFGRAINPIEFGFRQEGLESVLDDLPSDILDHAASKMPGQDRNLLEGRLNQLNPDRLKPTLEKLKLSFFVRVFGDEIRYGTLDKQIFERLSTRFMQYVNPEMFSSEEGRQSSNLFIDRALSLPTCSGLPVRLSLRGTYRSQVRPNVHPKFERTSSGGFSSISVIADVKAGLSIELRSSMASFLGSREYGVQSVTRIVSKAEYKPEFELRGRHLKLKVDLPNKVVRTGFVE